MTTTNSQIIKKKRGRPPLSSAKKMQRKKAIQDARAVHKALRAKIASLKADFKEKLKLATQEAYQRALEKVVKNERKKMEENCRALEVAKAKIKKKSTKVSQRLMMTKGRRAALHSGPSKSSGMKKRGRPRKS